MRTRKEHEDILSHIANAEILGKL